MKRILERLHEEFLYNAISSTTVAPNGVPIKAREPEAPVLPMERWREAGGALYKTYKFRRPGDRNTFVMQLLAYESTTEHHAEIRINEGQVDLRVHTKDLDKVTELDREYARYADVLFRSLVYSPAYGNEG